MSIIYDALKKVERSSLVDIGIALDQNNKVKKNAKVKAYLAYILLACLGVFIANAFFNFLTLPNPTTAKQTFDKPIPKIEAPTPLSSLPPVAKKITEIPLVLNGIFFSQAEGYALINNQIVKVGDSVDGLTVKRIAIDEVELESQGSIIKLPTGN